MTPASARSSPVSRPFSPAPEGDHQVHAGDRPAQHLNGSHQLARRRAAVPAACRRLLGHVGGGLSDTEVVGLRDQLYALARSAVAAFTEEAMVLGCLPPDVREEVEERAAILQFDAHLPRGLATRAAVATRVTVTEKGR